ncbi:MAG: asparagine--tRNA ligase, partial [Deltaproteobacteria bacterium]
MVRTRIAEVLRNGKIGQRYEVLGWVRSRRDSKAGFSFIDLNDGSCLKNLQIIADKELPEYEERVLKAYTGCSLKVIGVLSESPARGQAVELRAEKVEIIGPVDPIAYPLQKKRHSFEFLRTIAHLRPRTNTFGAVARVRNAVSYAIHKFFQDRGFIYVHTPIITGSDCEGAGELFHVTSLDLQELAREGQGIDYSQDLFGKPANLTVSGQMEAEAYALALGNVYTFGPTFRAENSNTSRHLAEFWMVEPEMAFCDLKGNIEVAEQLLKFIFNW